MLVSNAVFNEHQNSSYPGAGEGGCDDLGDSFLLLLSGMSSSQTISNFLFPS